MYRKNARVTVCKTEMQYMDKNKLNHFASFLKPSHDEYLVYINSLLPMIVFFNIKPL